jgi:ABC-type polysaccharide/polyol phosphate transport system ATPase subunit
MSNNVSIQINRLSKRFFLYESPKAFIKELFHPFRKKYHRDFLALDNLSAEINKGDTIGILGRNGAGKSTLLKLITGVLTPTSGNVKVQGKISSLLELGAGFNPALTGIENIYFQGLLMGMKRQDVDKKIDEIIGFADIGEYINQPVKTYSSGMFARLAFAVSINTDADVLIVDEALSVGDPKFQQKCIRKMQEFKSLGKTILYVSHDTQSMVSFCNKIMWLKNGKLVDYGPAYDVSKKYMSSLFPNKLDKGLVDISQLSSNQTVWHDVSECDSYGEGKAQITHVSFMNQTNGTEITTLNHISNDIAQLSLCINVKEALTNPIVGILIKNHKGEEITGINNLIAQVDLHGFDEQTNQVVNIEFQLPRLSNGTYSITVAVSDGYQSSYVPQHWIYDAVFFHVDSEELGANIKWTVMPVIKRFEVEHFESN